MRKKELKSKLILNKEIITNLNAIKGGADRVLPISEECTENSCLSKCADGCNPPPNYTEKLSADACIGNGR